MHELKVKDLLIFVLYRQEKTISKIIQKVSRSKLVIVAFLVKLKGYGRKMEGYDNPKISVWTKSKIVKLKAGLIITAKTVKPNLI